MDSKFTAIVKNNVEYQLLPFQFFLLTFCGIWCPKEWSFQRKNFHKIYYSFIFILNFIMCAEMLIYFILSIGTDYFKLTNLFFVSASLTGVYKSLKIMRSRHIIRSFIISYFNYQWMIPNDNEEIEIHQKINLRIRHVTITYFISMASILLIKDLAPLAESGLVIELPVDGWYPYPIENSGWFCATYIQQVILGASVISAHVSIDTIFVGLLLKTLCQIDILKYRLQNMLSFLNVKDDVELQIPKNMQKKMIFRCIEHHERIIRFGRDLNSTFQEMLIILVVSSLPNICINIYALSTNMDQIDMEYIATFFSTTSALIQFFIACWFGNEVSLQSLEIKNATYEMDWTKFDVSVQKLLVMIMTRSLKPIEFSISYIIPMNLDSFLKIIKASYTAFNLLQKTDS